MRDRYFYDYGMCKTENGWAQIDTTQDAWYYGMWTNPSQMKMLSYVEGDVTIQEAESPEEYIEMIRETAQWSISGGYGFKIDAMFNQRLSDLFLALGLKEFLH